MSAVASTMDLLLLPGLLCDDAVWSGVIARLGGGARCAVPAYAGERTLEAMALRVLAGAPPRFALAGHSMGARVALEAVRLAPERIERLALLDTGHRARPEGPAGESERTKRFALLALARDQGMRAMGREWIRAMIHPTRLADSELTGAIVAMVERRTPGEFAAQIEALLARPDRTATLRAVGVPTLVGCGRDDAWSPLDQHREITALVPGARLVAFDDCGHMAPMERPDAVAGALADWLGAGAIARPARASDSVPAA